jgi:hypothetical protein
VKILVPLFLLALGSCVIQSSYAQEQAELEPTSDQGSFLIRISWIENGLKEAHTFSIKFIEPETGTELEDIQYNFMIVSGENGDQVVRRVDQISTEQKAAFDQVGSYIIMIEDIEGLGENATLPIQVTPEFPIGAIIPVTLVMMVAIIAFRYRAKSLFTQ